MPPVKKVFCSQRQNRRRIGVALCNLNFIDARKSQNNARFRGQQITRGVASDQEISQSHSEDNENYVPPYMLNRFLYNTLPVDVSPGDASAILFKDEKLGSQMSGCSSKGAEVELFPNRDDIIIHGFDQSCSRVDKRESLNVISDDFQSSTVDRLSHKSKSTSSPELEYIGDPTHESETSCKASESSITYNESNPCLASRASSSYNSSQNHGALRTYTFQVDQEDFLDDFKQLTRDFNMSNDCVTATLKLINPAYPFLPLDYRTLFRTPKNVDIIVLKNGAMHYFGIEFCIRQQYADVDILDDFEIDINIDGLPIFKSSGENFWPILGYARKYKHKSPFVIAIFSGTGKPDPVDSYLEKFIDEVDHLEEEGMELNGKKFKVKIRCFCCDAPARAWLKNIKGHTAIYACERCCIAGFLKNRHMCYPTDTNPEPREDSDFRVFPQRRHSPHDNHIKNKSALLRSRKLRLKSQFVLDPMHKFYLGITKRLFMKRLVCGKRNHRLSNKHLRFVNDKIKEFRAYVPFEFQRKGRSLVEIKRLKATEFRLLIKYEAPVLLRDVLAKEKYEHLLLLHCALWILSDEELITKYEDKAQRFLEKFVKKSARLYGPEFVSYNVHSCVHTVEDVKKYGPIDNYSCFVFENELQILKRLIHSPTNPLRQIVNRIYENFEIRSRKKADMEIHPIGITYHNKTSKDRYECKSIRQKNLKLSTKAPDNIVYAKNKVIRVDKIIFHENKYMCVGTPFRYLRDFYKKPIRSSKLGIYYATSESPAQMFSLEEIDCKCMALPFSDGFVVYPLTHCLNG
ncbi:hypothetical protein QAD02_016424 [Eretmocerus hayati]|uniref:Uncharacterized protein n=3 Tax=Eretmocerus hayati TaxID=131215 RepID=A0ACC2NEP4_9HYME|nr:hypothetical protein QAD02_000620 [Eretmocerus hayati]KAJ8678143.1 hypothetical protein QAD02_013930 [Eretmocerus hayati]KAJ8680637.1 hypothetical protein QAD02_016424 [Eretmocerus hayati]